MLWAPVRQGCLAEATHAQVGLSPDSDYVKVGAVLASPNTPGIPVSAALSGQLGPYTLLETLGAGGSARVYLARAERAGGFCQEVALKLLHEHLREDRDSSHELLNEAKLVARIRHPNVVQVFDVQESERGICLVMEYIEGGSLDALNRRAAAVGETVPVQIALRILLDALAGLHAAHELRDEDGAYVGLVHRDFSPQNILVSVDGVVKLADFGIAKATRQVSQTAHGILKGKAHYMSPEQARGQPLDRRTDVWAAGVLAWEILAETTIRPKSDDVMATLVRILSERAPLLRSVRPLISAELERAVRSALERSPTRRCVSAQAFRAELEAKAVSVPGISSNRQVGAYVKRLLGAELTARRQRVFDRAVREPKTADERSAIHLRVEDSVATELKGRTPSELADVVEIEPGLLDSPFLEQDAKRKSSRKIVVAAAVMGTFALSVGALFASTLFASHSEPAVVETVASVARSDLSSAQPVGGLVSATEPSTTALSERAPSTTTALSRTAVAATRVLQVPYQDDEEPRVEASAVPAPVARRSSPNVRQSSQLSHRTPAVVSPNSATLANNPYAPDKLKQK